MSSEHAPDIRPLSFVQQAELALHEWLAVLTILSFILFLTFLSFWERTPSACDAPLHYLKSPLAEIRIEGAVALPGTYQFLLGTTLKEALDAAVPLPTADLRHFKGQRKVHTGLQLYIKSRPTIEIEVAGAVKAPGKIILPRSTRLLELGKYVDFAAEADLKAIAKKRYLKSKEVIVVPTLSSSLPDVRKKS